MPINFPSVLATQKLFLAIGCLCVVCIRFGTTSAADSPSSEERPFATTVLEGDDAKMGKAKRILPTKDARRIIDRIKRTGELTLSVWLTPGNLEQQGPARIITISKDASNRNLTLGQDNDRFDVRFRSTGTDNNGLPSITSPRGSVQTRLTHVAFSRDRQGLTKLFVNGRLVAKGKATGSLKNWSPTYRLAFGDEVSGQRLWSGRLHRVDWFSNALPPRSVERLHAAGVRGALEYKPTADQIAEKQFRTKIAPLLAGHCLECHDSASAEGGLVLDRVNQSMEQVIVPGDLAKSVLWTSIVSDSMPHDRAPLSSEQKELLRDWIVDGAKWSQDWIDPADYQHDIESVSGFVRRLTIEEYIRSVRVAVGVEIGDEARDRLPADVRADGFQNTAYNLSVDLKHIQAYNQLAKEISDRIALQSYVKRFGGKGKLTDKDMRGLIQRMGQWILRGPLNEDEIVLFRGISTTVAAAGGDYESAVRATITAMLQSPRFLYRVEHQHEDGQSTYVDDYELASRLSFLVWGAPPDRILMDAASNGELSDLEEIRSQVERMLEDPRAIDRSLDFVSQWLNLTRLKSMQPGKTRFPEWDAALAEDMKTETREFFRHLVWEENRAMSDLLNADVTFLTPKLAQHYGIDPVGAGLQRYDLKPHPSRGGLLTHGSVLTIGGDDASMVTRGLFVLNQLLRGVVNDPPPCVDTTPVPTAAGVTQRMIAKDRISNEACGGCHKRFEPLAFGLERYDGIGRYLEMDEHGNELREDGEMLVPGSATPTKFESSAELMDQLATNDRVGQSLVWKLTQFAIGRPLSSDDSPVVREVYRKAKASGGTYQATLIEIATSRLISTPGRMTRVSTQTTTQ